MSIDSATIKIDSKQLTLQQCFTQNLYEIPEFQRPYSWEKDQLEDFYNDVILANGDFFFGSTVAWISETDELFRNTYSIIDGQQRLTTATIALAVIRDLFRIPADDDSHSILANNQVLATQEYILAENKAEGKVYPVINRPEPNFYQLIQNPDGVCAGEHWEGRTRLIRQAKEYFKRRLSAEIESLSVEEQLSQLRQWRNNIVKARLIQVELASEEDGFLVFETLNTRGADLRLMDLVKNRLIRLSSTDPKDRSIVADRWEGIRNDITGSGDTPQSLDRFIWQSWNSRRKSVKQADLYKALVTMLGTEQAAHQAYLDELEADARIFSRLNSESVTLSKPGGGTKRDPFSIPEFVDAVRALAVFGIDVANSAILAVAREYARNSTVTRKHLVEVVRAIEKFHFQFSALASSGSSGGIRERYNGLAVKITAAKTSQEVSAAVDEFTAKLLASLPESARVKKIFRSLFYAPNVSLKQSEKQKARKPFITYVLAEFAKYSKAMPRGVNPNSWSVEHLRPQSKAYEPKATDPTFSIGNLILLDPDLNVDLGDGTWQEKSRAVLGGGVPIDPRIEQWDANDPQTPSDDEIAARAEYLASKAIDEVWAIK